MIKQTLYPPSFPIPVSTCPCGPGLPYPSPLTNLLLNVLHPREKYFGQVHASQSPASARRFLKSRSRRSLPRSIYLSFLPRDGPLLLHGRQPCPCPPVPTDACQTPLLESTPPGRRLSPLNRYALDFPLPGIPSDVDDNDDTNLLEQPMFDLPQISRTPGVRQAAGARNRRGNTLPSFATSVYRPRSILPLAAGHRRRQEHARRA